MVMAQWRTWIRDVLAHPSPREEALIIKQSPSILWSLHMLVHTRSALQAKIDKPTN